MNTAAWQHTRTEVEHLIVRYQENSQGFSQGGAGERDAAILRPHVERLLDTVNLQPAGLPSSAVFIVRKLEHLTPLPLTALAHSSPQAWHKSIHEQIQTLYDTAARPVKGSISPTAASVLFSDPGELLTCLTRDLLTGNVWQLWYWQSFLRNVSRRPGTALATLWCKHATIVPTVLASLNAAEAVTAITLLAQTEVTAVTQALHASFDVPSEALVVLRSIETSPGRSHEAQLSHPASLDKPQNVESRSETASITPLQASLRHAEPVHFPKAPPWEIISSSILSLTPQAHYLLELGLALYHAPSFARSTKFAQQVVAWLRTSSVEPDVPTVQTGQGLPPFSPSLQTGMHSEALSIDTPTDLPAPERLSTLLSAKPDISHTTLTAEKSIVSSSSAHPPTSSTFIPPESGKGGQCAPNVAKTFTFGSSQPLPLGSSSTQLSGILYLIHLLTWLNLPNGWDEDGTFSEGLSGWAIVDMLAKGLLGATLSRHIDDPIWHVLALLDAREPGVPMGTGLSRQTAFRLPAQWLLRYDSSEPVWHVMRQDTVYRVLPAQSAFSAGSDEAHSYKETFSHVFIFDANAGYLVADIPLAGQAYAEAVLAEVEAYRSRGINARWHESHYETNSALMPLAPIILPYIHEHAAWWLKRVLGFMRFFLLRRLNDPEFDADRLGTLLIERPGKLIASRTHIDLHMSMEQISLPIRRAGLDRDPGWMPDLGRIVLFHFD